jgi:PatG C-terminal
VLTVQGLETYLLTPRDPTDIDLLVEAIRPAPSPNDIDVVIGWRGPIAPPEMCNGLMVPIVAFDQIYSFDRAALLKAIPKPDKVTAAQFGPAAEEVFSRIMQLTDNAGATDGHRALNYLAMRYPAIYARAAEELQRGTQPRVIGGPHAVDFRRRTHGRPCGAEPGALGLPLSGPGPAPSRHDDEFETHRKSSCDVSAAVRPLSGTSPPTWVFAPALCRTSPVSAVRRLRRPRGRNLPSP